ncbi:MAG TPA: LLM class flavin-dependent oxidoreductase [Acidimicrobiales bacterium]|nr:LLM class flavin-dependent oxidoreductase [Acidimicrobiales bacterium]
MPFFALRFDLRNPALAGTTMTERYQAALDMSEWADRLGFVAITISEHHGVDDGYLPSPLTMAAAIAARTRTARINLSAVVAPFHDPLRLAEDLAVVDLISGGRLDVILANGYVADEFAMFGRRLSDRAAASNEVVATLRAAWTGEPFTYRGRTVRVTPAPHQPGGPSISLGGSTEPAARRAARLECGFSTPSPPAWDFYRDETIALGRPDPGPHPAVGDTSFFHLAADVEKGWLEVAPYAMHEATSYGKWMADAGVGAAGGWEAPPADADELRARGQYRVLTPDDLVAKLNAGGPFAFALFHPLMGGIPPELGWSSLRLFEEEVLPRVS